MAILNFNASQIEPMEAMEAIPAGWYNAMVDESEMKPTKDGQGSYLQLRFTILDGQYVKRKVFTRLNINNKNAAAQEIAYRQLSAIAHAIGELQVQDSQQLHGKPLKIKVTFRPADGDYDASNDINGFKSINETSQASAPQAASPAWAQPTPPASNPQAAPAWQQPANQQPWQQPAPTQTPAQPMQQAPAAPAQAPVAPSPVQQAAPNWQNVPAQNSAPQQAPVTQAAQGEMPAWMQEAATAQDVNPPWVQ